MFVDPVSAAIVATAPVWLPAVRDTLLSKGKDVAIEKGKDFAVKKGTGFVRGILQLDEKEQLRHLELALKNAVERGIVRFNIPKERDQYREVLKILFEPGSHSDAFRREALRLLTLSDTPNLVVLNEAYNQSLRTRALSQLTPPAEVDAAPYLSSFFGALIAELYADPFFRQQMSDVLQLRYAQSMQRSLLEVVTTLRQIGETLEYNYTPEQFEQDVQRYVEHVERSFRYLKLVGVVPKDRGSGHSDPELQGIYVPLRIALQGSRPSERDSIVALLKDSLCLVLLGGPGSGKSTVTRHLAWSHALANLPESSRSLANVPLLSGKPLPLHIELRRLTEDRRQHPEYDFLSYATEVLLGREGIEINPQMFKELLERRSMLLLFDGLDEVTTLDERRRLVEEIEHFFQRYPGNLILVTSRPIGYELAPFSSQWFSRARVQEFNDEQIRQFLEYWYRHVLRLSPIPDDDQQELEALFTTLKENTRLHRLAENPLLLTAITALHRYERLPDKRVQVYDRCADLLLETWAKLKGTNVRWKDMKMVKEDQYACVAHLGFILHERSQEKQGSSIDILENIESVDTIDDAASDVPTRFMLREIEHFLHSQKLLEVAERRVEAKRFLEMIQEEAGLIVERGTDESGESLYGFVHHTFQEYFAAADVYERYQQEEDPTIISDFLKEHLHDLHWGEAILLLLGKLKRKPVTTQLGQILEGKIKSYRSQYTDIIQQDLFLICDCLKEEIVVENELAEIIVLRLGALIRNSPFSSQRTRALEALASLMQTRQYADLGRRELRAFVTQEITLDIPIKVQAARNLYLNSSSQVEEKQQAIQMLLDLAQQSNLSIEQAILVAEALYDCSSSKSEEERLAIQMLLNLMRRSNISVEQAILLAHTLYEFASIEANHWQQVVQILWEIAHRYDLSTQEAIDAAEAFYAYCSDELEERQQIVQMFLGIARRPDLSAEQTIHIAEIIYSCDSREQAIQMLMDLIQRPSGSVEQAIKISQALMHLYMQFLYSYFDESTTQQIFQTLLGLAQQPDLSIEQATLIAQTLYICSSNKSKERQQAIQILLDLIQQLDLSIEQATLIAQTLYICSSSKSKERQQAIQILLDLIQQPDLSIEQATLVAQTLYICSSSKSKERQQAVQMLWQLSQNQNLTTKQRLQAATIPLTVKETNSLDRAQSVRMVLSLIHGEKVRQHFEEHWRPIYKADITDIPYLFELVKQENLPSNARDEMYRILRLMVPQFDKIPLTSGQPTA